MRKKVILILLLVWTVAVAAAIFGFSSQTGEESGNVSKGLMNGMFSFLPLSREGQEILHHIIRKSAHMAEYSVLSASVCVLFFYLADIRLWNGISRRKMAALAFAFSSLFAATDEIHQMFVPGRGPSVKDVLIDIVGASIGIALIYIVCRYKKKKIVEAKR